MIIDFHAHAFPEKIAASTVSALAKKGNVPAYSDGTVNGLLEKMNAAGIDIALNLPVLTKPTQFDSILKYADRYAEKQY